MPPSPVPQKPFSILCLSHLVWEETLFQRPQQLMRRLAERGHTVHYIAQWGLKRAMRERRAGGARRWSGTAAAGRLTYQHIPFAPGAGKLAVSAALSTTIVRRAARSWFQSQPAAHRLLWIYHPNYLPVIDSLPASYLVYDCMDHFAGFRAEKSLVREREETLGRRADILFTGGRSLHASKKHLNASAHCFPSGVEVAHFARATDPATQLPEDLAAIPGPRLGYFGAVDERIDWKLLAEICRAKPNWHVVFLGPLVMMPRCPIDAPNFHYLGPRPYATLPAYLKGFDVCLMPFVQSELVAHISPTKTPEYLAGGRPVVSSPVPDVIADYANEVAVCDTPATFIDACERAIAQGGGPSRKPPAARTWDEVVEQMETLILHAAGNPKGA